ncbi:3-hydroxyacyl-CoA dehydrogenase NAD-binding domain-containing protein [Streptomyces sp. NPDC055059]
MGTHFFNPVPAMPLVELVGGSRHTSDASMDRAESWAAQTLGKQPIRSKDRAGFVVNALLVPVYTRKMPKAMTPAVPSGLSGGDVLKAALTIMVDTWVSSPRVLSSHRPSGGMRPTAKRRRCRSPNCTPSSGAFIAHSRSWTSSCAPGCSTAGTEGASVPLHVLVPGTATSAGPQEGRYAYRVASSRTVAMSLNGSSSSLTIW